MPGVADGHQDDRAERPLRLFETKSGEIVPFVPDEIIKIYVCGITPYDATHMGHAATYITYDVLSRRLIERGHDIRMVRNITDIDDDLLARARRDGVNYLDLAFGQKRRFDEDMATLGNLEPWSEPRATSAIPDVRGLIHDLLNVGAAYESEGWVYFDHTSAGDFGSLSGVDVAAMAELGSQRGEDPDDPRKRRSLDTVLWRTSESDEPEWESPWGPGRPGWHVECVALALRELGGIDLHGGGRDLMYPHHEFCCAQLTKMGVDVRHWMHQSCVHLDGEPMSKSTGNLIFIHDLLASYEPMLLRLAVLSQHYRSPTWVWEDALLSTAKKRLNLWRSAAQDDGGAGRSSTLDAAVSKALDDDLNVPMVLRLLDSAAEAGGDVRRQANRLGVVL